MKKYLLYLSYIFITVVLFALSASAQSMGPKTVRDYFMLLPGQYFSLDCCGGKSTKEGKEKYLKQYLDVEDTANGYMKGWGDGAQDAFEMALFKKPDGSYVIAFYNIGEGDLEDVPNTVFLQYRAGRWTDVSKAVVPNYEPKKNIYQLPRNGTTVEVFQKDEAASDFGRGKKLCDLTWAKGKFKKS
jgi:hypothetical protein